MISPKVSVVIIAFNEEGNIKNCLKSLVYQKCGFKFEVILVDNNSTDKTVEFALNFKDELNLKIISEKKQGRGAARAKGFKEANGQIIFSGDADAIYPDNWLSIFTSKLEKSQAVAITGTMRINDCSVLTNRTVNFLQPKLMMLYKVILGYYWLSGFNFAIKKDTYEQSGGFDSNLQSQEDIVLSPQVHKIGKIEFLKKPVLVSGRRFKKGLSFGLYQYLQSFIDAFIFKKDNAYLDNPR